MTVEEQLKEEILLKYKSVRAFTQSLGIPYTTLDSVFKRGISKAGIETMLKVFDALDLDIESLNTGVLRHRPYNLFSTIENFTSEEQEYIKKYRALDGHGKKLVELIMETEYERCIAKPALVLLEPEEKILILPHNQLKASAGTGYSLDEESTENWKVLFNEQTRKADFCVDVQGDSMEPMFYDGDTILVRSQPAIDVGQIGLYITDGAGYVKRQGEGCLQSLNPAYADIFPSEYTPIECKGLVIGRLEREWIREM